MANPRVHEIAAELGIESNVVLTKLKDMGQFVKGPSSSVAPPVARRVKAALEADGVKPAPAPKPAVANVPAPAAPKPAAVATPAPAPAAPVDPAAAPAPAPLTVAERQAAAEAAQKAAATG
ncbi:translation initiation factor IF-2 N-terminal domain-containing protein, partial [Galbitalea sp. SE-J8]|uniref:translation initiation factor IF-2 N-terminal domain-containing protein n=1 Tax=Galbitalea sp. SE-J8 TaxID=3054952 RepID=UPI00259CC747